MHLEIGERAQSPHHMAVITMGHVTWRTAPGSAQLFCQRDDYAVGPADKVRLDTDIAAVRPQCQSGPHRLVHPIPHLRRSSSVLQAVPRRLT